MNKDRKVFMTLLLVIFIYFMSMIYYYNISYAKTIGDDKHLSSNTSVVIGLNKTLTLSGVFLNYTNGYVSFYNASMNGEIAFNKVGIKPSSNITINKIGGFRLNYTTSLLEDKVWSPLYGIPNLVNGGSLLSWDNINKVSTILPSSSSIEINWLVPVTSEFNILILFILIPMMLVLFLIAWRVKR